MTLWKIYCRMPGAREDYAEQAFSRGFIAMGWGPVGHLGRFKSPATLRREFDRRCDPHKHGPSMLWKFKNEVEKGHLVLLPSSNPRCFHLGEFPDAKYEFVANDPLCPFEHRRRVRWFRTVDRRELRSLLRCPIGGMMSLARVRGWSGTAVDLSRKRGAARTSRRPTHGTSTRPDAAWGRAGELRAKQWLEERLQATVRDVAADRVGWDLETDACRYEVKTRRPGNSVVLSRWEREAALQYRRSYVLLVLTAADRATLSRAVPRSYADPARLPWRERLVPEYVWRPDLD